MLLKGYMKGKEGQGNERVMSRGRDDCITGQVRSHNGVRYRVPLLLSRRECGGDEGDGGGDSVIVPCRAKGPPCLSSAP